MSPILGGGQTWLSFFSAGNFVQGFQTLQRVSMKFGLAIFAIEKSHDPLSNAQKNIRKKRAGFLCVLLLEFDVGGSKILLTARLEQDL